MQFWSIRFLSEAACVLHWHKGKHMKWYDLCTTMDHTGKELLIATQSMDGQEARVNKNPITYLLTRCAYIPQVHCISSFGK